MLVVFPYPIVQVSLWRCNLETTDWIVVPGAWVPNPPNADGCREAFWGFGYGKVKALLRKPRHQHLLVGDPLNSVGFLANGSQAVPVFKPHDSSTNSYSQRLAGWKAGSPTSKPLLLKTQSRQVFLGLQLSHTTIVTNLGDHNCVTKPSASLHEIGFFLHLQRRDGHDATIMQGW